MKNVLISGASGGIGSEIARKFASLGYRLLLIYNKNKKGIEKLCTELAQITDVAAYQCDIRLETQVKQVVADVIKKYRRIDCLVNAAGVAQSRLIQDVTESDFDFVFGVNVKGSVFLIKHVVPHMVSEKMGNIINISSMWGEVGASMESVYSASKGAIDSLTKSLAKELAPSHIRVNAVSPGLIDTKMNKGYSKADLAEIISATPISRIGKPSDVANVVEFLASESASFITGQIITVDGGLTL